MRICPLYPHPFKGGSRGGGPFVMTALGCNIQGGEGLFPKVLEVLGTFPSSGHSWDAHPLKEWGCPLSGY